MTTDNPISVNDLDRRVTYEYVIRLYREVPGVPEYLYFLDGLSPVELKDMLICIKSVFNLIDSKHGDMDELMSLIERRYVKPDA